MLYYSLDTLKTIPVWKENIPSSLDICGLYQYLLISRTNLGVWLPSPIPSENIDRGNYNNSKKYITHRKQFENGSELFTNCQMLIKPSFQSHSDFRTVPQKSVNPVAKKWPFQFLCRTDWTSCFIVHIRMSSFWGSLSYIIQTILFVD